MRKTHIFDQKNNAKKINFNHLPTLFFRTFTGNKQFIFLGLIHIRSRDTDQIIWVYLYSQTILWEIFHYKLLLLFGQEISLSLTHTFLYIYVHVCYLYIYLLVSTPEPKNRHWWAKRKWRSVCDDSTYCVKNLVCLCCTVLSMDIF